ncbi:hypothetical protein PMm318_A46570 [Pseudomonas moorei]
MWTVVSCPDSGFGGGAKGSLWEQYPSVKDELRLCGEGACSRWTAQQSRFGGRFAPQREQAPSPQFQCPA